MTLKEYIKNPDLFKWNGKEEVDLYVLRKNGMPFRTIDGTVYKSFHCDFIDYDFTPDQVFASFYDCKFVKEVVSYDGRRAILIKLPQKKKKGGRIIMKDFYIEIDGYCDTILAIYHIKANNYEEAVKKAKEIYVSEPEFSNIETRDEAEEKQCNAGVDDLDAWNGYEYGDDDQDDYIRRRVEEEYGLEDGELDRVSIREAEKIVGEEYGALDRFIGRDYETDEVIEWAHDDWDSGHPCDWEDFDRLCEDMGIAPAVREDAYTLYNEYLHSENECDDEYEDEKEE